jgi:hypothetical protein
MTNKIAANRPLNHTFMKFFVAIFFCSLANHSIGQDSITVTLFDYKTDRQIQLRSNKKPLVSLLSNNKPGQRKMKLYNVNQNGQFTISKSDIDTIGDNFTFSVNDFYETGVFSYADFEIRNVSKDNAKIVLTKIYLTPSYWINSCGADCFLIDNRRTFKKEKFTVRTPYITYQVIRIPGKITQKLLDVKYVTDLKQDIIKE